MFFGIYSRSAPVRLVPGWLDGREVIAVYEDPAAVKPSYLMWLEWANGRISFIRDYKYVRYVIDDADLVLAADVAPSVTDRSAARKSGVGTFRCAQPPQAAALPQSSRSRNTSAAPRTTSEICNSCPASGLVLRQIMPMVREGCGSLKRATDTDAERVSTATAISGSG